jgi:hypothetical protein
MLVRGLSFGLPLLTWLSLSFSKDWIRGDVDIRQLLVETHGLGQDRGVPVNPYRFFDDIQGAGFAMFSKEPNIHPRVGGRCVEWGFVRLRPDFFGLGGGNGGDLAASPS